MNTNLEFENEDPSPDSVEDNHPMKVLQERMYSEEEVLELLQKALIHQNDGEIGSLVTIQGQIRTANFYSWFEQFKKNK